jgi:hypothetical protein
VIERMEHVLGASSAAPHAAQATSSTFTNA